MLVLSVYGVVDVFAKYIRWRSIASLRLVAQSCCISITEFIHRELSWVPKMRFGPVYALKLYRIHTQEKPASLSMLAHYSKNYRAVRQECRECYNYTTEIDPTNGDTCIQCTITLLCHVCRLRKRYRSYTRCLQCGLANLWATPAVFTEV